jgi:2-polyprenyl-3-methyl-5-hydroxy-6-metoxy-1,4-benzoquinol methylase
MIRLRDKPGAPVLGTNMHCANGHQRLTFVEQNLYQWDTVLDVACGEGGFALALHRKGYKVTMTDILPVTPLEGIPFVQCRIEELLVEFDQYRFDVILLMEVIEHLEDPRAAIETCMKLLMPNGRLLITTPWVDTWDNAQDHIWRFDIVDIVTMCGEHVKACADDLFIYAVVKQD